MIVPTGEPMGQELLQQYLEQQVNGVAAGVTEGWSGGSSDGANQDVFDTMAAIRALVGGDGYTRVNITSTQTWTKPTGVTEVIVVGIAAGQDGGAGNLSVSGGAGGLGGGHKVQALDPSQFSSLYVEVGTSGAPTRFRLSSGGTILSEAIPGGQGSMATQFGYTGSASSAGNGGAGGRGNTAAEATQTSKVPGMAGQSSAAAQGGAGGPSGTYYGEDGSPGVMVSIGALIPCGGGGGGGGAGGGSENVFFIVGRDGGAGGAGGFPGGGGGGGGGGGSKNSSTGSTDGPNGAGGAGAAGLAIIYYR